jgi:LysM repeat protein
MSKNKIISLLFASTIALGSYVGAKALDHKVEKGDTLIKIAEKYLNDGELYDELARSAGIVDPNLIRIGDIIKIPDKETLLELAKAPDEYGCTPIDMNNPKDLKWKYYQMKKGDTLYGVYYMLYANFFKDHSEVTNVTNHYELRSALKIANNIEDERNIQIGTKIYLMEDYELFLYTMGLKNTNRLTKTRY